MTARQVLAAHGRLMEAERLRRYGVDLMLETCQHGVSLKVGCNVCQGRAKDELKGVYDEVD
jgi:hypothetical protein